MRLATGLIYGTATVIVVATVLSGPLVGAVDFTRDRSQLADLGEGNVTVDHVSAPDRAAFDRAYQSENYYLEVPDAVLNVSDVSGRPIVAYRLEIPAMSYSRSTSHFLGESRTGAVRLALERDGFTPGQIEQERYEGRLSVVARYNDTERVLYEDTVPVEVTE